MIINGFEEGEQVEKKTIEIVEEEVEQLIEVEQLAIVLSTSVKGGFFDVELDSLYILVVPTKVWSKFTMRCKRKE
jgi:hypothetical protein